MSDTNYDFIPGDEFIGEDFSELDELPEKLERVRFVDCRFNSLSFVDIELRGCVFEECSLDFTRICADFIGCALTNCSFRYADLLGARFIGCKLTGSNLAELTDAGFLISGGDWSYTQLKGVTIKKHDFDRVNFSCASLFECKFESCKLCGVSFDNALVNSLSLKNSDISGTSFDMVNFGQIDFKGCKADLDFCVSFARAQGIKVVL